MINRKFLAMIFIATSVFLSACKMSTAETVNAGDTVAEQVPQPSASLKKKILLQPCLAFSADDPNALSENQLRSYINDCTGFLLEARDYKALDAMIESLRSQKARTSSGLWAQSFYYAGIEKYLAEARSEEDLDGIENQFADWLKFNKESDAARLAMSMSMTKRAWLYRGNNYSNSTSADAFDMFHKQISKALKFLLENEGISKRDPEWFTQLFSVLRSGRDADEKKYMAYVDKAVSLYPDYYPIYFSASVYYLPKWHGDSASFDEFAKYATRNLSPGNSKAVYARIYWANACTQCGESDVANWREHWDDIRAGFDQIIKEYPDQWNINNYARIACSAYDQDKTLEIMQRIEGEPNSAAWDRQFSYSYCANWSGLSK